MATTTTTTTTTTWHAAVSAFLRDNPEFARYGRPATPLEPRYADPMKLFAYYITYQALSARSCDSMWEQLVELVEHLLLSLGARSYRAWPPRVVAAIPDEELYGRGGVGLSRSKIRAIKGMAAHLERCPGAYDRRLPSREAIRSVSDRVKGVGPFTVASFLIEAGRLDVANCDDVVVRKGMMIHYGLGKRPSPAQARKLAEGWGRFKTVGTKYMFYVANRPPRMPEFMCHIYERASRARRR